MTAWTVDIIEVGLLPDLPLTIYVPDAAPDVRIDVPCFSFLLSSGSRHVLVDTGPDQGQASSAGFVVQGNAQRALRAALATRGSNANDVEAIIHTHLHYDHVQNDHLFPQAMVLVNEREVEWAGSGEADRFYLDTEQWLDSLKGKLAPLQSEMEVFPGVTVLPNGGHTPGHQSVLVETVQGAICLCGDIIPMMANVEIVPACLDPAATRAFQERARGSTWDLLPGHDPSLRNHRWYVSAA